MEVKTDSGESIFLLINHLKSKWGGNTATSNQRRQRQAQKVWDILNQRYDLTAQNIVVAGDFNDTPTSAPLSPLIAKPNLHDVLELQFPGDPSARWTYHYTSNEQIDYLLVSGPMRTKFHAAGVWRRGIADVDVYSNGAVQPYNAVTGWRDAASDHGAVWAEFDF